MFTRSPERKYKRKYTVQVRKVFGSRWLRPKWELDNPSKGWHGSTSGNCSSVATALVKIKGRRYWVNAQIIPDGEAGLANLLAYGVLGLLHEPDPTIKLAKVLPNGGRGKLEYVFDREHAEKLLAE